MTAISIKEFKGMVPRSPDHLLADSSASYAQNCDFSRGMLVPLKGGLEVLNVGGAIRGIYTEEGQYWYTWPGNVMTLGNVIAYRSPVIDEIYGRIYYIDGSRLRVSPSPLTAGRTSGGPPDPAASPLVGVPNPTVAPALVLVDRTTLADYPTAAFEFKAWYSDGVANYGVTTITPAVVSPFKRYTFTAPAKPAEATEAATFVVQAKLTDGTKQLFLLDTAENAAMPARSQALPGGVVMLLEVVSVSTPPPPPVTTPPTPPTPPTTTYAIVFEWGVVETRAYVFTTQNTWNEESGPSPATLVSPTYLQDVRVTVTWPDYTGYRPFKQTNIYRTFGGPDYIMTGVLTGFANGYIDSARTVTTIGVSLPSLNWVPPPINMFSLVSAPNGWFAGHYRNTLYMSEPFRPHTWQYTITFPNTILGICMGPSGLVVTTGTAAFLVTGPHPHSVTSVDLPVPVGGIDVGGGLAQRHMCAVDGGVAFLTNDGVVLVEGSQASLSLSQRYFTRETWRAQFGSVLPSMQLAYHDGCLVGASTNSAAGFVLEMDEAGGAMTRYDTQLDMMARLPLVDTLYYATGGRIYRFREGNPLDAAWNSKQFITTQYVKLGIGFARGSGSGTVVIRLYADETLIYTHTFMVTLRTIYFRLPPHRGALKWQFQITTTGVCSLEDVAFAQSPDELKNV